MDGGEFVITREQAHAKVDEIFDELDKLGDRAGHPYELVDMSLQSRWDGVIEGVVLVRRTGFGTRAPYVTWGVMPHQQGLHSGHYDMDLGEAVDDWYKRVKRGW